MVAALTPISQRCTYAGSLRRWRETIGDIDILAAADDSGPLMAAFAAGHEVVVGGPAKTTVRTATGLTADLRVINTWPLEALRAFLRKGR
jgi:DNA polymerase (family X)